MFNCTLFDERKRSANGSFIPEPSQFENRSMTTVKVMNYINFALFFYGIIIVFHTVNLFQIEQTSINYALSILLSSIKVSETILANIFC